MVEIKVTKRVLQAQRYPILEQRAENREYRDNPKSNGVYSQEVEDECNRQLREINCAIQGIPNPDTDPEGSRIHQMSEQEKATEMANQKMQRKAMDDAADKIAKATEEAEKILEAARKEAESIKKDAAKSVAIPKPSAAKAALEETVGEGLPPAPEPEAPAPEPAAKKNPAAKKKPAAKKEEDGGMLS